MADPGLPPGSWWQRLSLAAKAAYLAIVAVGAVVAALLKPVAGDANYGLRWAGVGATLVVLLIVTSFFRRRR